MIRRAAKSRSGQSLIEVLVAISLLVFGVFAVLRVFPVGFSMLSRTAAQEQVKQLASAMAEGLNSGQLGVPDGVVELLGPLSTGGWSIPNSASASPGCLSPDSVTNNLVVSNALFMQRGVQGERFTLHGGTGSILLNWGPLYFPSGIPSQTEANQYLQVYDPAAYTLVTYDSSVAPAARQYAVDASNKLIYLSRSDPDYNDIAGTTRAYILSYRTTSGLDVVDEPLSAPPNAGWPTGIPAFAQGSPLPGSVKLCRAFPYGDGTKGTYNLVDPFAGVLQIQNFQVAYPSTDGSGNTTYTWFFTSGQTLAVDYSVRDWQILRLGRNVPPDGAIHLPIRNLDVLDRNVSWPATPTGVYSTWGSASQWRVLVLDLSNVNAPIPIPIVNLTFPGAPIPQPVQNSQASVNVRDGIVYLPVSMAGHPVRVYYASYDTYAVEPFLACSTYLPSPGNGPGYCYYTNDGGNGTVFNLGFAACDVGKVVSVDYHFVDSSGNTHWVAGKPVHIQGDVPVNPSAGVATIYCSGNSGSVVVDQVKGISLEVRAIFAQTGDLLRADDPAAAAPGASIWNPGQTGKLMQTMEDVYVPRQ